MPPITRLLIKFLEVFGNKNRLQVWAIVSVYFFLIQFFFKTLNSER